MSKHYERPTVKPLGRVYVTDVQADYVVVSGGVGSYQSDVRITVSVDPAIREQFASVLDAFESPSFIEITLDVDKYFLGEMIGRVDFLTHQERQMQFAIYDGARESERAVVSMGPLVQSTGKAPHTVTLTMRALTVPMLAWTEWSR